MVSEITVKMSSAGAESHYFWREMTDVARFRQTRRVWGEIKKKIKAFELINIIKSINKLLNSIK